MSEQVFKKLEDAQANNRLVWSTEVVNELSNALDQGYKFKGILPFHEGRTTLRKGRIPFKWTKHERAEIKKCATDIVYFANKYCTVMTDDGLSVIKLRDYQENMLNTFSDKDKRFHVCLASRQIGKCVTPFTDIYIKLNDEIKRTKFYKLWYTSIDTSELSFKYKLIHKLKYKLYQLYDFLD